MRFAAVAGISWMLSAGSLAAPSDSALGASFSAEASAPRSNASVTLLIARPADLSVEGVKSAWVGPLSEALLHFRLGALSSLKVVSRDTVESWVKGYNDLSRAIPDAAFLETARKKNISHVLFQRHEVTATSAVVYLSELYAVAGNKIVLSVEREFPLQALGSELDAWIASIMKALGLAPSENAARFFRTPAISGSDKDLAQLGQIIQDHWYGTSVAVAAGQYAKMVERNRGMHLAAWLGAASAVKAKKQAEIAGALDNMLLNIGPAYPELYAIACEGYRQAKRNDDALRMALLAEKAGISTEELLVQKALALQAKGERTKARETYLRVLTLNRNEPQALLFLAEQSNLDKAFDMAVDYADRILARDPKNGRAFLEKGRAQAFAGRIDEALKSLMAASELLKDDPAPFALMGDLYAKKKDIARAAENYQKAISGMPDDLEIRLKAARCLRETGKQKAAIDILKKSEPALSRHAALYREMGLLEYETGDSTNALTHLEMYAKSNRKDGEVLSALGTLYLRTGRIDLALAALSEALPLIDEKAKNPARLALAKIHIAKKNMSEAATLLAQIAAVQPSYPEVNRLLGDTWLALGDKAKAVSYYARARTERAGDKELQALIAQLHFDAGNTQSALSEYQTLVKLDPSHAQAYFRMASLALKLKAVADAERYLKSGEALGKADAELYYAFGQAVAAQGADAKAIDAFRACLDASPTHAGALERLAGLYAAKNNDALAAEMCWRLYQIDGDKYASYLTKAVQHLVRAKKNKEALDILKKSEAAFLKNPALYREAGMLEYQLGDSAGALLHLEQYLKTGRKDGEALGALGVLYSKAGRADQAQAALTEALPLIGDKNPVRLALAKIHLAKKNYREAVVLLDQIAAAQPDYPEVTRLLGDAAFASGDKAKALKCYIRERSSRPADKDLQAVIAQLAYEHSPASAALKEYEALLKIDPSSAQSYYRCASLAIKLNALADAERYLKMGSALAKPDPELYLAVAQAYAAQGVDAKAIEYCRLCLDASPQHIAALQQLIALYAKKGSDTLAGEMCWRMYQSDPDKYKSYLVKAADFFEKARIDGKTREAYAEFLVKKKYADPQISLRAARLEYRLKNCSQTLSYLDGVTGPLALDIDALMMRLECAAATDRHADALGAAEKIVAKDPTKARAYEAGALAAEKIGDAQKAIALYERYLSLLPLAKGSSDYAFRVGELYEKRSMPQAAIARYAKNIGLYPKESRHYDRLTALYLADKRYGDAMEVMKKGLGVKEVASPAMQKAAAQTLVRMGNSQQAIFYYEQYLKAVPDDSGALYDLGMMYYEKKSYPQSVENLSKASALMPRNFDCHYLLGSAFVKIGNADKAASAFERARAIRDKDTLPLAALAECYRTLKRDDDLAGVLRRWLDLRQGDATLSRELGMLLLKKGKTADALPLLETASRAKPGDIEVHTALAEVYKQQSNDALRLLHLEAALKSDPKRFAINYELGLYYADKKSPAKAADYLRVAAGLEPKNAVVRFELGRALAALNRNEEALDQFRAAVMGDPGNLDYLLRVIELSYRLGQKKEAAATVKLALELDAASSNAQIPFWAGILLMESGSPDSAKRYLQKAAGADRSCGICFQYLGDIALSEGNTGEAIKQYTKALGVNSGNEVVLVKIGKALLNDGKPSEAERMFERTLGQNSKNDEARYHLCSIYLKTNRVEAAQQVFASRPKDGQSGWHHLLTAVFEEREGNTRQALLAYAAAARALPENLAALNGCGRMYVAQRDYENGLMYLGKAAAVAPDDIQVMVDMARAYEGLGNRSAAQDFYQEAMRRDPSHEDACYGLARIYSKENHPKAIETLKKGLEKNRNSPRLSLALAHEYRLSNQINDAIIAYQQVERIGGEEGREASRFIGDIYYLALKDMAKAKEYYSKYAKAGGKDQTTLQRLSGL